jgi:hypothetical protein
MALDLSTSSHRLRSRAFLAGGLAAALALGLTPPSARAGEREWVVTPALGYAAIRASGRTAHGGTGHLEVDYGLTDAWALRAAGRYALAWAPSPQGGALHQGSLTLGALYTFDVLKVVPWMGLVLGASITHGAGEDRRVNAELQAVLGADYLVRRDFSFGLSFYYALQAPDVTRFPWMFGLVLRLSYRAQ